MKIILIALLFPLMCRAQDTTKVKKDSIVWYGVGGDNGTIASPIGLKRDTVISVVPVPCDSILKWLNTGVIGEPTPYFKGTGTLGKPIHIHRDSVNTVKPHRLAQLALLASSVIASGFGDGLNSRTFYTSGHLLSAYSYAALLAIPFTGKVDWKMPVSYILLRYALFDLCYNMGAHRKLNYIGGKNFYDESLGRMPGSVFDATKIISFGVVLYINTKK